MWIKHKSEGWVNLAQAQKINENVLVGEKWGKGLKGGRTKRFGFMVCFSEHSHDCGFHRKKDKQKIKAYLKASQRRIEEQKRAMGLVGLAEAQLKQPPRIKPGLIKH